MFDFYHSGHLDLAFMGAAEIAPNGDINVSKFGGRGIGCGGFIDITQSARKVVFCSTLTGGGLEAVYEQGRVKIVREGRQRKFLSEIQQVTFSGAQTLASGREAMLVTERAVFQLESEGWTLTEVAPGQDAYFHRRQPSFLLKIGTATCWTNLILAKGWRVAVVLRN